LELRKQPVPCRYIGDNRSMPSRVEHLQFVSDAIDRLFPAVRVHAFACKCDYGIIQLRPIYSGEMRIWIRMVEMPRRPSLMRVVPEQCPACRHCPFAKSPEALGHSSRAC